MALPKRMYETYDQVLELSRHRVAEQRAMYELTTHVNVLTTHVNDLKAKYESERCAECTS